MTTSLKVKDSDSDLKKLFIYNRSVPNAETYAKILELENKWIIPRVAEVEASAPRFSSRAEFTQALKQLLKQEENSPSEPDLYMAEQMTLDQFKVVISEFAVDGLTESQSLLPIVPRLPHKASMAVFRVLIDEFGCGNVEQAHSQLYRDLLTSLGMPTDLHVYVEKASDEIFAYVNLFYWLTQRAPKPEYFLGAYSYFESSVPYAFQSFVAASKRLGLSESRYYTEHVYIDTFHSQMMQTALRELDNEWGADFTKAWVGVELTSKIVAEATEAAINKARNVA